MRGPKAHERRTGIWEAKGLGPDGRRRSFYGSTAREATEKARESLWEREPGGTLYGYYAAAFVPALSTMAPGTRKVYASAFDKWWIPRLGDRELGKIGRADVQRVLNLMARELSTGTVAQYRAKLSTVLAMAAADGEIAGNPARGARIARVRHEPREPLEGWELRALLESTEGPLRNAVSLMGFFGLRLGEACGLLWSDFHDQSFDVRRQWPDLPLKTSCSYRPMPVPEEAVLDRLESLYVVGEPPHAVRRGLARLGFHPHALRHTFDTVLEWELECPRQVTTALMGHKGDTTQIYSHRRMGVLRGWLSRYWAHVSDTTRACRTGQAQMSL